MADDVKSLAGGDRATPKPARSVTPQAQRALDEASARRRAAGDAQALPPEINGRKGPEPVRYGDWENKGIASDF